MTIADWLMITAVFLGPIVAVRITRYLDDHKEIRERKVNISKKEVIEAWKEYLDLLNNSNIPIDQWVGRRIDLLVELLHKMAKVLQYDFDKTHIKNSSYSPRIHGETEDQQATLRKGLIDVLDGKRPLPMNVVNWPQA